MPNTLTDFVANEASVRAIADDCKNILVSCVMKAGYGNSAFVTTIGANVSYDEVTGTYEIDLSFDGDRSRESWYPTKYPEGAYDIVGLMNNGYKAKDYVYKDDGEVRRRSLIQRKAARFIQMAASEIENKYRAIGAIVTYNSRYG